jgi:hypothetical protein
LRANQVAVHALLPPAKLCGPRAARALSRLRHMRAPSASGGRRSPAPRG